MRRLDVTGDFCSIVDRTGRILTAERRKRSHQRIATRRLKHVPEDGPLTEVAHEVRRVISEAFARIPQPSAAARLKSESQN